MEVATMADMTGAVNARTIDSFAAHLRGLGRRPDTIRERCCWPARLYRDLDCTPWQVDLGAARAWIDSHEWAPATRRQVLTSLHQFAKWADAPDPTVGLAAPWQPRYTAHPIPRLVLANALADATGQHYWLLRLLATTGLRRGEAARLMSSDLSGGWLTITGKGGVQRRVPVPEDVAAWISTRHGPVFTGIHGQPTTPPALACVVRRLTGYGPHAIRHRFATDSYAATHDIRAVQTLLGHASVATTQIYVATDDRAMLAAVAPLWAA